MSKNNQTDQEPAPEDVHWIQDQLDRAGDLEREAILAEAQALDGFPGEERMLQVLEAQMQASASPSRAPRPWGRLLKGMLGVLAAAALLLLFVDGPFSSKDLEAPPIPEGFSLDGKGILENLQPLGAVSEYGAFAWTPSGSLELSAELRIWDDTPAGRHKSALAWKGITDNELPFDPGVELPARIRWEVLISNRQGLLVMRSEPCSAHLQP